MGRDRRVIRSPSLAQFVQNHRRWPEATRLSRLPRRRQRFMHGAALVLGEVIAFVVSDQVDNRAFGQGCRLVENEPPLFDAGSERAHETTVRVSEALGKRSRCSTDRVDLLKPRGDLVPTGRH